MLALPSAASAQSGATSCPGGVGVSASKICVYVAPVGGELVINNGGCSYVNAYQGNPGTEGYAGLCPLAPHDPTCDGSNHGTGSNKGGCFWIKPLTVVDQTLIQNPVTDMFICGNTSGEDPQNAGRDGCFIP